MYKLHLGTSCFISPQHAQELLINTIITDHYCGRTHEYEHDFTCLNTLTAQIIRTDLKQHIIYKMHKLKKTDETADKHSRSTLAINTVRFVESLII